MIVNVTSLVPNPIPYTANSRGGGGTTHNTMLVHCCQVSPRLPGQIEKQILQNKENKILYCHRSNFKWFG